MSLSVEDTIFRGLGQRVTGVRPQSADRGVRRMVSSSLADDQRDGLWHPSHESLTKRGIVAMRASAIRTAEACH
jgi:hypothetical protein